MKTYEGMFIVDPVLASTKWDEVDQHLKDIITNYRGRVLQLNKWGERKLAYPIKHQKRGTYVLTYFEAPEASIGKINSEIRLSEIIWRAMILVKPKKKIPVVADEPVADKKSPD